MKQKSRRTLIVLLIALIAAMLLGVLITNGNFSTTTASADSAASSYEDSLTFNLFNNGTEYKVSARNKKITEAIIPDYHNGLPVTEIADNSFTNCANLKYVRLSNNATRIGNNAFANCKNLEVINGMGKVESVGNNAFAMCVNIDATIIPDTVKDVGTTPFRNNNCKIYSRKSEEEMNEINANWKAGSNVEVIYGNELVLDEVHDGEGTTIGYNISMQQNLNTEADFVLGDTYNGLPLLGIEKDAFAFSTFNSFTLKHGEIITDVDNSIGFFSEYDYDDCDHTVNIKTNAFSLMTVNYIDILVDVTFYDEEPNVSAYLDFEIGHSVDVFSNSTVRSITLPNNIDYIPRGAFSGCTNLREIKNIAFNVDVNHISENVTAIGSEAFAGCESLINLYMPSSIIKMGNAVFSNWGNNSDLKQTIYFNDLYEAPVGYEGYDWDANWDGIYDENSDEEIPKNVEIKFKTIKVLFDKEGGKADVGTNSVDALYHVDMPEAVAPEKEGFSFEGYFLQRNGKGDQYYDKDMNSVRVWNSYDEGILYAYWTGLPYEVTFNKDGGVGGTDGVTANYMSDMPEATAPAKTGYNFTGYYYLEGNTPVCYYDKDMNSVKEWDITQDAELVAGWQNKEYHVLLDAQGGQGGDLYVIATYDNSLPEATAPTKAGFTFLGYFKEVDENDIQYYDENMLSVKEWDIDEDFTTLYAHWTQAFYTLTLDKQYDEGVNDTYNKMKRYDELPEATAPTRTGYEFKGYFNLPDGEGKRYYNADMTPALYYNVDDDLTLYADWDLIDYAITYELNGGTSKGNNPDTYNVETPVTLNEAYGDYGFIGWTLNVPLDEGAEIIENLNGLAGDITLVANWDNIRIIIVNTATSVIDVTDESAIILFNVAFQDNCTINTSSQTSSLGIIGYDRSYNLNININATEEFSLLLFNIKITAHSNKYAIYMNDTSVTLNLYTRGVVRINGYTPVSEYHMVLSTDVSMPAIYCGELVIGMADSLSIYGGNGKDGKDNYSGYAHNGGDAAPAIVTTSDVYILCSNVTISGGTAGNGGSGKYYGRGGAGAWYIVGVNFAPHIYVLEGTTDVKFKNTPDGNIGEGDEPIKEEIINPPIERPWILPELGGSGGGIIIPRPPVNPIT